MERTKEQQERYELCAWYGEGVRVLNRRMRHNTNVQGYRILLQASNYLYNQQNYYWMEYWKNTSTSTTQDIVNRVMENK